MLDEALRQLCPNNRTLLGLFVMICVILGFLLHTANYFWNRSKPKASKKPLLWLAGTWLLVLAALALVIYVIIPPIVTALIGPGNPDNPCSLDYHPNYNYNYTKPLPYCGGYCENQSIPKDYQNCTCQHLAVIQD